MVKKASFQHVSPFYASKKRLKSEYGNNRNSQYHKYSSTMVIAASTASRIAGPDCPAR